MARIEEDPVREERIYNEAVVDAYGPEERALGWYYYLDDRLYFPFKARCIEERRISLLKVDEEVDVIGMAPEEDCETDIFVEINALGRTFGVPLSQLQAIDVEEETQEAMEDWHYWVARGYLF